MVPIVGGAISPSIHDGTTYHEGVEIRFGELHNNYQTVNAFRDEEDGQCSGRQPQPSALPLMVDGQEARRGDEVMQKSKLSVNYLVIVVV